MQYMGGKMRAGKQLAEVLQTFEPFRYYEPFCGMFSVGKHISCEQKTAGDIHPDLILMLEAAQAGWSPPTSITEEQYNELRIAESSALRGFVGFGCSFYGRFFGGFARDPKEGRNFCATARNNLLKLVPLIQNVKFQCASYLDYKGDADVIYCDPPYAGAKHYSNGKFNHEEFWDWARNYSQRSIVCVSEYTAPNNFEVIWEKPVITSMRDNTGKGYSRIERLFTVKGTVC